MCVGPAGRTRKRRSDAIDPLTRALGRAFVVALDPRDRDVLLAELDAYCDELRATTHPRTLVRYASGAAALLGFLHARGVALSALQAQDLTEFRAAVRGRGMPGRKARWMVQGALSYLRHKVRSGGAPVESILWLGGNHASAQDAVAGTAAADVFDAAARFAAQLPAGYTQGARNTYRIGATELLLFLARRGVELGQATAADFEAFHAEALARPGRSRTFAVSVARGARAFIQHEVTSGRVAHVAPFPAPRLLRQSEPDTIPPSLRPWPRVLEEAMSVAELASGTRVAYRRALRELLRFAAEEEALDDLASITRDVVTRFRLKVQSSLCRKGTAYTVSSQISMLCGLRFFFGWVVKSGLAMSDPTAHLPMPRQGEHLPRVPRVREVTKLLASLPATILGLRDRALVELLYGTGMRRSEVAALRLADVDLEQNTVFVRQGKGGRQRMVPLGARAREAVADYLELSRPKLLRRPEDGLLLSFSGLPITSSTITARLKALGELVGLTVRPHMLRHACATHLLRGRADIRHIQKLLGHKSLRTTERYTRVEVSDLSAVVRRCHPRGRLER